MHILNIKLTQTNEGMNEQAMERITSMSNLQSVAENKHDAHSVFTQMFVT